MKQLLSCCHLFHLESKILEDCCNWALKTSNNNSPEINVIAFLRFEKYFSMIVIKVETTRFVVTFMSQKMTMILKDKKKPNFVKWCSALLVQSKTNFIQFSMSIDCLLKQGLFFGLSLLKYCMIFYLSVFAEFSNSVGITEQILNHWKNIILNSST